jgi:hypothetical protein
MGAYENPKNWKLVENNYDEMLGAPQPYFDRGYGNYLPRYEMQGYEGTAVLEGVVEGVPITITITYTHTDPESTPEWDFVSIDPPNLFIDGEPALDADAGEIVYHFLDEIAPNPQPRHRGRKPSRWRY